MIWIAHDVGDATDRLASKDEAGAILKPSYGVMREGLNGAT